MLQTGDRLTVFLRSLASFPCPAKAHPFLPLSILPPATLRHGANSRPDVSATSRWEVRTLCVGSASVPHSGQIAEPTSWSHIVHAPHSSHLPLIPQGSPGLVDVERCYEERRVVVVGQDNKAARG